jgi:hypothetical protein
MVKSLSRRFSRKSSKSSFRKKSRRNTQRNSRKLRKRNSRKVSRKKKRNMRKTMKGGGSVLKSLKVSYIDPKSGKIVDTHTKTVCDEAKEGLLATFEGDEISSTKSKKRLTTNLKQHMPVKCKAFPTRKGNKYRWIPLTKDEDEMYAEVSGPYPSYNVHYADVGGADEADNTTNLKPVFYTDVNHGYNQNAESSYISNEEARGGGPPLYATADATHTVFEHITRDEAVALLKTSMMNNIDINDTCEKGCPGVFLLREKGTQGQIVVSVVYKKNGSLIPYHIIIEYSPKGRGWQVLDIDGNPKIGYYGTPDDFVNKGISHKGQAIRLINRLKPGDNVGVVLRVGDDDPPPLPSKSSRSITFGTQGSTAKSGITRIGRKQSEYHGFGTDNIRDDAEA